MAGRINAAGRMPRGLVLLAVAALLALGTFPAQANADWGSISGRVLDRHGNPVSTCVSFQSQGSWFGGSSDADGWYTSPTFPPGEYWVQFGCWGDGWVREYYDDETGFFTAQAVPVGPSEHVVGIDARLIRGGSISGRLVDDMGRPPERGYVTAWMAQDPSNGTGGGAVTNPDGTYTITGLAPGVYKVSPYVQNQDTAVPAGDGGLVVASDQVVSGVDLTVASTGEVSGRVTNRDATPVDGACVAAKRPTGDPTYAYGWATTDATGAYHMTGVHQGTYTIEVTDCMTWPPPGRFAPSYLGDGFSRATAPTFSLAGHEHVTGQDVVVRPGGTITGTVHAPDGAPQPDACLQAVVTDGDQGYGLGTTDDNGQFTLRGLRPGDYELYVRPCRNDDAFLGGHYRDSTGAKAVIPVADGAETSGIDVHTVKPGAIEGALTDDAGQPVAGACVLASRAANGEMTVAYTYSNPDGTYRLSGLDTDSYFVYFGQCGGMRTFVPEYWQDAYGRAAATPIAVTVGQTVPGISTTLAAGGAVLGSVTKNGAPLANACVYGAGPDGDYYTGAYTDSEGRYTLSGFPTGSYKITAYDCVSGGARFTQQWWHDKPDQASADPVDVANGQATHGIDFTVSAPSAPRRAPIVRGITPSEGAAAGGNVVSLVGFDLADVTEVRFGDTPAASVDRFSKFQVDAVAPPGEVGTTVDVVAVGPGGTSTPVSLGRYTYVPSPELTSVSPSSGPMEGGNEVVITGSLLGDATAVQFGGVHATSYTVDSDTSIRAVVPASQQPGPVDVQVQTPRGTTPAGQAAYTYETPPLAVTSVSPTAGPESGGTTVQISGFGLADAVDVRFGTQSASFWSVSDSGLTAMAPGSATGPGFVDVTVVTPHGTSPASPWARYEYVAAPVVSGVSPNEGAEAGGDVVQVSGTGLGHTTQVLFGGSPATFTVQSDELLVATAPAGHGTVPVQVVGVGGASAVSAWTAYTYFPAPAVTAVNPAKGSTAGGQEVHVLGTGLDGVRTLTVDGAARPFTALSAGELVFTAPAHARGPVTIGLAGPGGSTTTSFRYVGAPSITSLTPPAGPVTGKTVTLTGLDFVDVQKVEMVELRPVLGPTATPLVHTVVSEGTITVQMPVHAPGDVFLRVTTAWGQSAAGEGKFTYQAGLVRRR